MDLLSILDSKEKMGGEDSVTHAGATFQGGEQSMMDTRLDNFLIGGFARFYAKGVQSLLTCHCPQVLDDVQAAHVWVHRPQPGPD